jgi:hypothetical protein
VTIETKITWIEATADLRAWVGSEILIGMPIDGCVKEIESGHLDAITPLYLTIGGVAFHRSMFVIAPCEAKFTV